MPTSVDAGPPVCSLAWPRFILSPFFIMSYWHRILFKCFDDTYDEDENNS